MNLIPPIQPTEAPAFNGCTCQCHYVPGIKHVMPCCSPTNIHLSDGGSMPPVVPLDVVVAQPEVVRVEPVIVRDAPDIAFTVEQSPEKSDRQLLRELFYASDVTGRRVEEVLVTMGLEDLWREVYARLERR